MSSIRKFMMTSWIWPRDLVMSRGFAFQGHMRSLICRKCRPESKGWGIYLSNIKLWSKQSLQGNSSSRNSFRIDQSPAHFSKKRDTETPNTTCAKKSSLTSDPNYLFKYEFILIVLFVLSTKKSLLYKIWNS